MNNAATHWHQRQSPGVGGTMKPTRLPSSESIGARAEADRAAIERWEDEGGTPVVDEERSHAGPGVAPWGGSRPRGRSSS